MFEFCYKAAANATLNDIIKSRQTMLDSIKADMEKLEKAQSEGKDIPNIGFENETTLELCQKLYEHLESGFNVAIEIDKFKDEKFSLTHVQKLLKKAKNLGLPLRLYVMGYSTFGNEKEHVDMLFSKEMMNNFVALNGYLLTNNAEPLRFMEDPTHPDNAWTLKQVVKANNEITTVVNMIKMQNFSPFEAIAYIHYYLTSQFPYKENTDSPYTPRSIVGILNSNDIVCVGYARFVKAVIDQLNMPGLEASTIECMLKPKNSQFMKLKLTRKAAAASNEQNKDLIEDSKNFFHLQNLIKINDEKYNIQGHYISDACWDSKNKIFTSGKGFGHFMYPIGDAFNYNHHDYYQIAKLSAELHDKLRNADVVDIKKEDMPIYKYINKSKPIPTEKYQNCIYKIFRKTYATLPKADIDRIAESYMVLSKLVAASTFNKKASHNLATEGHKFIEENPDNVMLVDSNQVIK